MHGPDEIRGCGLAPRPCPGFRPGYEYDLNRVFVRLTRANAHHLLHCRHEDLPVADLAGLGGLHDRIHAAIGVRILHHDFHLHLRQEVDHVFSPAVQLGVALLAAETLDFGDRESSDPDYGQGFADFLELEWLDDGG